MVHSLRRRVMVGLSAMALAAALTAPAIAQQAATEDRDTVIITGSRIRVDPLDQLQPITTVGEEEIDKTGLTSTADILQRLPIASGGLNQRNNNSGNFGNPPDGGGVGAGGRGDRPPLPRLAPRARPRRRSSAGCRAPPHPACRARSTSTRSRPT